MTLIELIAGIALVYGAGVVTGWNLARRSTRYMLGWRQWRRLPVVSRSGKEQGAAECPARLKELARAQVMKPAERPGRNTAGIGACYY